MVLDDNAAYPAAENFSRFKIEGTRGYIAGTAMGDVNFRIQSELLGEGMHTIALDGSGFPTASSAPWES